MNNDKMKNFLKISERDKVLLVVVFAGLIIALSYFVGFQNLTAKADEMTQEHEILEKKEKDLREKYNNKKRYQDDTVKFKKQGEEILKSYANGDTFLSEVDFINNTENVTTTWIRSVSFGETTPVYTFGRVATSNPNAKESTYVTDMVGYKTSLSMLYEAKYEDWKSLIKYVNTAESKNSIESMSMVYNEATDVVSGTMVLSVYSITGKDRVFNNPKYIEKIGTNNIFLVGDSQNATK